MLHRFMSHDVVMRY